LAHVPQHPRPAQFRAADDARRDSRRRVAISAQGERAQQAVTGATTNLLESLKSRGTVRTREGERDKAQRRWQMRRA
jgi:hypothetical protein